MDLSCRLYFPFTSRPRMDIQLAAFRTPCRSICRRGLNTTQKASEAESALRIAHRIQDFAEASVEPEKMPFKFHLYSVHRESRGLPLLLAVCFIFSPVPFRLYYVPQNPSKLTYNRTSPALIARCVLRIDTDEPQSCYWAEEISGVTLSLFPVATSQGVL